MSRDVAMTIEVINATRHDRFDSLGHQVRDLEAELENEARRVREAVANQRKAERLYKEFQAATEEERRQLAELAAFNDQLQLRIKTYKRQLEEAVSGLSSSLKPWRPSSDVASRNSISMATALAAFRI